MLTELQKTEFDILRHTLTVIDALGLPKEQQTGHHYYVICDVSRPYTDYIKRPRTARSVLSSRKRFKLNVYTHPCLGCCI